MARDYKNRTSKGKSNSGSKTRKKKASAVRVKAQTGRQVPWRAVILLVVIIVIVAAVISIFFKVTQKKAHAHHSASKGVPVVTAKPYSLPVSINKKSKRYEQVGRSVDFIFQGMVSVAKQVAANRLMLELGTYTRNESNFILLKQKLIKHHINVDIVKFYRADVELFRVEMGPYKSQKEAGKVQQNLEHFKIYSIIKSR